MDNLRKIPAIDEILMQKTIKEHMSRYSRQFVVKKVRASVERVRQELLSETRDITKVDIMNRILKQVENNITAEQGTLHKVINGTGVVLHTNLGRAPLSVKAVEYINKIAPYYNNLEMNLAEGKRGSRYDHVESLLVQLTGAEAALVVNNNAAAVLLGLNTIAVNKEVIVSRGQLVEIGGAFRIPEVMKLSGARLVEVGTTNKTYSSDFEAAINENTAMLFAAHTSNYKIIGFTQSVPMEELVDIGQKHALPVMHDLGSGALYDLHEWGLSEDPLIQESIKAGIDIISFSGDKLLGGPQAGILVGKKKYIEAMKKNQLTRALRVDKLTIAALEGTLLEYLNGEPAENIPILKMISRNEEQLYTEAEYLAEKIKAALGNWDKLKKISTEKTEDIIGGGAYPSLKIPGFGVQIEFNELNLEAIVKTLRLNKPALIVRRQEEKMLISVRTLLPGDDDLIASLMRDLIDNRSVLGGLL